MKFHAARWTPLLLIVVSGCRQQPTGPVWNLPELVGQPINIVKQKLGAPQSEKDLEGGVKQSSWTRQDTTLVANWKTTNQRVRDWTLTSRDNSNAVREEERVQLLKPGRLQENDPSYSVDWLEASERPLYYTGVHIVPALKNHNVVLRVSGSVALVEVSYTATGQQGKSDTFLTMPPWEQSFTLPDDTEITFTVEPKKALVAGQTQVKAEILSDGKVVASASSLGAFARCQAEL